ncbi:MAG: hypothetical protein VX633_05230, partial [Verrucomicrobiota bacterium]|nr:hypothetical protein [Verrucomicrobiota bacterium]
EKESKGTPDFTNIPDDLEEEEVPFGNYLGAKLGPDGRPEGTGKGFFPVTAEKQTVMQKKAKPKAQPQPFAKAEFAKRAVFQDQSKEKEIVPKEPRPKVPRPPPGNPPPEAVAPKPKGPQPPPGPPPPGSVEAARADVIAHLEEDFGHLIPSEAELHRRAAVGALDCLSRQTQDNLDDNEWEADSMYTGTAEPEDEEMMDAEVKGKQPSDDDDEEEELESEYQVGDRISCLYQDLPSLPSGLKWGPAGIQNHFEVEKNLIATIDEAPGGSSGEEDWEQLADDAMKDREELASDSDCELVSAPPATNSPSRRPPEPPQPIPRRKQPAPPPPKTRPAQRSSPANPYPKLPFLNQRLAAFEGPAERAQTLVPAAEPDTTLGLAQEGASRGLAKTLDHQWRSQ